jgi:hypothetical protein
MPVISSLRPGRMTAIKSALQGNIPGSPGDDCPVPSCRPDKTFHCYCTHKTTRYKPVLQSIMQGQGPDVHRRPTSPHSRYLPVYFRHQAQDDATAAAGERRKRPVSRCAGSTMHHEIVTICSHSPTTRLATNPGSDRLVVCGSCGWSPGCSMVMPPTGSRARLSRIDSPVLGSWQRPGRCPTMLAGSLPGWACLPDSGRVRSRRVR